MRILAKHLFLFPVLVALHSGAQTFTTYSTLGDGTYSVGSGWIVNGSANLPEPFVGEAFAFTATTSGYLAQLNLAISAGNGNLSSDFANIFIAGNSSRNLPGVTLESFLNVPCTGQLPYENPITSLNSSLNPFLQAGDTYWLYVEAANPNADIVVNENDLGVLSGQAQEFSPSAWIAKGNQTTFAFDVELSAVPEPSTTALAALGLVVLISPLARSFRFNPKTSKATLQCPSSAQNARKLSVRIALNTNSIR
jgi:PEP-CTERM motif